MIIKIKCPKCGKQVLADADKGLNTYNCKNCKNEFKYERKFKAIIGFGRKMKINYCAGA